MLTSDYTRFTPEYNNKKCFYLQRQIDGMMTGNRTMDDEMLKSITERLVATGFREYDAIIYVTLFTVGIAKVSELHELTGIPRGRIYDTLEKLHEGGFVTEFGSNPQYYQVCETEKTFISI